MTSDRILLRAVLAVFLLAAPAVFLRILSTFIDAPYLQPLDLTEEGVAAAEAGDDGGRFARIDVYVNWGREWAGTMTRSSLRDTIVTALDHRTKFYRFDFEDVPGERIDVTFVVGPNRYGPFPPGQMAAGIRSALTALRMTNGPEER